MVTLPKQISEAASLLQAARYGVAFTGAGISTASGIPDFRSPESGLWNSVNPLDVASLHGFRANPRRFYDWVYPLLQAAVAALPNPAHDTLAHLESLGYVNAIITQNIDNLHQRAGSKVVLELHGQFQQATCTHCFQSYCADALIAEFLASREIPHCLHCGSYLKPNVILFGEQLPLTVLRSAQQAVQQADVVLIIGSSLEVAPANELPLMAQRNGAKLIVINLEPVPAQYAPHVFLQGAASELLPAILSQLETKR